MIIGKAHKIETCVSKDITRAHLSTGAYLDTAARRLVATDGHVMAVVPVEVDDGDHDGFITPDALKAARKAEPKMSGVCQIKANGAQALSNGVTMPRPGADLKFPPWQQVIPQREPESEVSISLNAKYLLAIAEALGCDGVTITISKDDNLAPIIVKPAHNPVDPQNEPFGILMPMR